MSALIWSNRLPEVSPPDGAVLAGITSPSPSSALATCRPCPSPGEEADSSPSSRSSGALSRAGRGFLLLVGEVRKLVILLKGFQLQTSRVRCCQRSESIGHINGRRTPLVARSKRCETRHGRDTVRVPLRERVSAQLARCEHVSKTIHGVLATRRSSPCHIADREDCIVSGIGVVKMLQGLDSLIRPPLTSANPALPFPTRAREMRHSTICRKKDV